jgi:CHASE3 domain sensor protein
LHFINVFITKRFMNKQWEREEIDKLVAKQQRKINELQKKVESDFGKSQVSEESEAE